MADRVTLPSLGKARYYCEQVNAAAGQLLVVLLADGAEADSSLINRNTLADVLAIAANKEAAWSGGTPYARKSYATVTITAQTSPTQVSLAITNPTWGAAAASSTTYKLSKLGVCYGTPATGTPANSAIIPLVWLDFPSTADGSDLTFTFDAAGFYRDTA